VSTGAKEKSITAGIAVGAVIAMEAMTAGPVTGASMNPARSIGPALISGQPLDWRIYVVGTVLGAISGMALYLFISFRGDSASGSTSEAEPNLSADTTDADAA
ncbi:MAG: aquaporin, partial [Planctomycetota bacterium]